MRWYGVKRCIVTLSVVGLAGCMPGAEGTGDKVSRFLQDPGKALGVGQSGDEVSKAALVEEQPSATETATMRPDGTASPIIKNLQSRRSVLPVGSSYDQVARTVMASSARIAEAELKAAHLRAQAAKHNWLPRLSPSISLTSLGDFVASLVVDQVLFDNGRKKAERDYARHDVEKAAVALSAASNDRVHEALSLYLAAEEGRAYIAISERSLQDMGHFEWILNERVKGGVSDMSDLNILRQKLSEIRSERDAAAAQVATAEAELGAMAGTPMGGLRGVPGLTVNANGRDTLAVLEAETERDLAVAQAKIARAQHLPGLSARGTLSSNADASGAITGAGEQSFGLGTGATLKAIETAKDTAGRKVQQAREDSARKIAALDQQAAGLASQVAESKSLVSQAKTNLDLFQEQYKAGARQVMDVVGVYETWASQSRRAAAKKFELERLRLQKAQALGVLVSGEQI